MGLMRSTLTLVTLLGILIFAAGLLIAADVLATGPPRPSVVIVSPEDNSTTDSDSLAVEVAFKAGAGQPGRGGPGGNVQLITVEIDGTEVGRFNNPPNIKEGTHTFDVDISTYPDGPITLQAHGFQGNERAGLKGSSSPAKITIDRSPPEAVASVIGTVSDDEANMVPGARVSIHRDGHEIAQTMTDADGEFEIEVTTHDSQVSVTARPPAPAFHGAATQMLTPLPGGTYDLHFVLWSEHPLTQTSEDPEDLQDTVTLSTLDSSVMISSIPRDLNIVGGSARAFSPTYMPHAFPGDFATRQSSFESGLISAGFASVNLLREDNEGNAAPISELRDDDGNPIRVELRFLIDKVDWHAIQDGVHFDYLPGYVEDRPDRINTPLYYFDEDLGDWLLAPEFGWLEDVNGPIPPSALPAIRNGTHPHDIYMTGLVDHFTWYNMDFPKQTACMRGRLIDEEGDPLSFSMLKIRSLPAGAVTSDGKAISFFSNILSAHTDTAGRFQVRVPQSETGNNDDWNNNGIVDTFAVRGEVQLSSANSNDIAVFDNGGHGYHTPTFPENLDCGSMGEIVIELKQAKLVDFEITFLEEDSDPVVPLFVDPPSFSAPNLAIATLLDTRVPLNGKLWQKTCQTDTGISACNHQSNTDSSGVAKITIPVLVEEDPGPLDIIEDLAGAFAYHKLRPDLGLDAYEFAGIYYLVPENRKSLTINVEVERRGPPDIEILQPDSDNSLVFLFDDVISLEATGIDVNDNSIDHLDLVYWSDSNQTRLLAQGRTNSIVAGTTLGSGTGHGIVAHGIDYWGWLGTDSLAGIEVATVEVNVEPESLALVPGDAEPLTAVVTGANNTSVTWTSSGLSIATVNASGVVTAVNPGSATITARSTADPTKTAFLDVEDLVAAFSITPEFADTETEFSFDGSLSTGDIANYTWDFGDGNSGTGETVTHTYSSADTYAVTLTVTGLSGATAKTTQNLPVGTADPVASFTASPESGNPPLEVAFDASASFDPDGQIVSWEWDFGDGNTGNGETAGHTYTLAGTFTVELTVTDNDGATGATTREIRVNQAPTASFTVSPDAGPAPLTVTVNASASGDPDGQIERYSWDFGDGTLIEDGSIQEAHTYTVAGAYTITLTVEDDGGLTDSAERSVTVETSNLPPVANFTVVALESEPYLTYQFDASGSFSPGGSTIVSYAWDFGDGSPQVVESSPEVSHRYMSSGVFDVRLTLEDDEGRIADRNHLVTVDPPVGNAVAVAAGRRHSLGLHADGTVWAWGHNSNGQLGNGTTDDDFFVFSMPETSVPSRVLDLEDVIAIAAGDNHSLALRDDGAVFGWGANSLGQLGDGTTTQRRLPVEAVGLGQIVAIAAGEIHSLALRDDGTVWAWGVQHPGGTSSVPVQINGLENIVSIAAGHDHSLALDSDGTVWAWGSNVFGQLGDGINTNSGVPVEVDPLTQVIAIAAGDKVSLALLGDGTVWAWGRNPFGLLGVDPAGLESSNVPVQVAGLTNITAIPSVYLHALAIKEDGTVWGWGYNSDFQASGAGLGESLFIPVQIPNLDGAVSAAAGQIHSLVLLEGGSVWAWGYNFEGQLGDGTSEDRILPVPVWWD